MARFSSTILVAVAIWCLCNFDPSLYARIDSVDSAAQESEFKPTRIALVDMALVFKSFTLFSEKREELKVLIKESEEAAKEMQNQIQQTSRKMESFEQGSDARYEAEKQLKRLTVQFEEFRLTKSRYFLKEESKIYRDIYAIVTKAVTSYAQSHKIDLVMRTNSENPLAEEEPSKLLQGMNRQVVYENDLDITEVIIAVLNNP